MDLIFEPQPEAFKIEVWSADTILEIKQKIEKRKGIPVSMQTLIFNGQTLPDDADIQNHYHERSHVQLLIAADFFKNLPVNMEELSPAPSTVKCNVKVKTPSSSKIHRLEMDGNDTVLKLKERIQEIEGVPMNCNTLVVRLCKELHDNQRLKDCKICQSSEIDVSLSPLTVPVPVPVKGIGNNNNGGGGDSRKLKVNVLTKGGKKIPMEVNSSDKVGELRKELQKLNQRDQFPLPSEGYFFICRQKVMDDDQSFRWHKVAQGDTIEIFKGSATDGACW